jgi:next-to-BRCA1 protein 1
VPPPVTSAAAPEPFDIDGHNEEKLLRELEEMGFRQIDLNKEILRQNNYNLEQSVDDLCGVNEWDPLLAELEEMVRCASALILYVPIELLRHASELGCFSGFR